MASIQSLPAELLLVMLECIANDRTHLSGLSRCALVCRDWRESCQRALHSTAYFSDGEQLKAWLASSARDRYCMIHLHFDNTKARITKRIIDCVLAESCETLQTLRITHMSSARTSNHEPDRVLVSNISDTILPHVHTLILESCPSYTQWPALVAALPDLATLEIQNFDRAAIKAMGESLSSNIRVVTLSGCGHWASRPFES